MLIYFPLLCFSFRPAGEKAAGDAQKKAKSKHPSSLSHSLFDAGEEEGEDDLFSAKKSTAKSKPAGKDMDALFDEVDQGIPSLSLSLSLSHTHAHTHTHTHTHTYNPHTAQCAPKL